MQISENKVVSIHYTLTNDNNEVLDSSSGKDPLVFIHGRGNIIVGLEEELSTKAMGDKLTVIISPEKAYGIRNESMVQEINRDVFQGVEKIEPGMQFQSQTKEGMQIIRVTKVDGDKITVDANHPLAGETLTFDVEVVDVRDATSEEIEHGHVHGPGGHEH